MKIKNILKLNIINFIILGLIILFRVIAGFMFPSSNDEHNMLIANIITVVMLFAWAVYTLYSNYAFIKDAENEEQIKLAGIRNRICKAGNLKSFKQERAQFVNMWDSLMSREKYFLSDERDERVRELYLLTRNQMMRNVTDACEFLDSYDYISGKDSEYFKELSQESQTLLDKFNRMVELSVSVDDETLSYDTREIDEMIESLEMMKKAGKNKLER